LDFKVIGEKKKKTKGCKMKKYSSICESFEIPGVAHAPPNIHTAPPLYIHTHCCNIIMLS
jgi:hypothetical protein